MISNKHWSIGCERAQLDETYILDVFAMNGAPTNTNGDKQLFDDAWAPTCECVLQKVNWFTENYERVIKKAVAYKPRLLGRHLNTISLM